MRRLMGFALGVSILLLASSAMANIMRVKLEPLPGAGSITQTSHGIAAINCRSNTDSSVRVSVQGLPPGTYDVAFHNDRGTPATVGQVRVGDRGDGSSNIVLISCPIGSYRYIDVMQTAKVILQGTFPDAGSAR